MIEENDAIDSFESNIGAQQALPNSTAVLVLGILSIVTCAAWGVIGLILGIIALVLSKRDKEVFDSNPKIYANSYKNSKAGKVCAIIGVSLSALMFLYLVFVLLFVASNAASFEYMNAY